MIQIQCLLIRKKKIINSKITAFLAYAAHFKCAAYHFNQESVLTMLRLFRSSV